MISAEASVEAGFQSFANRQGLSYQPSSSIVSHADRATLYITAGIQLLQQEILGNQYDGEGRANTQWCLRMNALDEVGHTQKLTSFRLMTALFWGGRSRIQQVEAMFAFFQDVLELGVEQLRFTVSLGVNGQYDDEASLDVLSRLSVKASQITQRPRHWSAPFGTRGPMGPNLFVAAARSPHEAPIHLWNLEFLEYCREGTSLSRTARPVLDSAGSVETAVAILSGTYDVHEQGALRDLREEVLAAAGDSIGEASRRRFADHLRSVALLLDAGVVPSARTHGAVLRRLIRHSLALLAATDGRLDSYSELVPKASEILALPPSPHAGTVIASELASFRRVLDRSRSAFDVMLEREADLESRTVPAAPLHRLHSETGVPTEVLGLWLSEAGMSTSDESYKQCRALHSERSRSAVGRYIKRRME